MDREYIFSFIIPVYNTEEFLGHCLDSLCIQQYENFEVIIVNDGSSGNCKSIVEEYREKIKNIVYVEQKNQGLSAARNKGIDIAKGKYCCFVDSDDYIEKDYIATLTKGIEDYEYPDLIIIGIDVVFKNKVLNTISPYEQHCINSAEGLQKLFESQEYRSHACTKVIKTSILKDNLSKDLYFPLNIYYEDVATIYKWIKNAGTILLIPIGLYKYNVGNPNSITSQDFTDKHFDLWNKNVDMYYNLSLSDKLKNSYFLYLQDLYLRMFKEMEKLDNSKKETYINMMRNDMKKTRGNRLVFKGKKTKRSLSFLFAYYFPKLHYKLLRNQEAKK
ncbi:hypothetical protein C2L96_03120 [Bacillus cereus]|nr:hypothetical protein C2L96_03120 [Bacillus cereus]